MKIFGRRRSRVNIVAVFTVITIVAILVDRITKLWAKQTLIPNVAYPCLGNIVQWKLIYNPGASLGLGAGNTWVISLFAIVASVGLCVAGLRTTSRAWAVALGLALGGALGNLIDRVIYAQGWLNGKVIDFIDYGWSIGNVADIILFFATIIIAYLLYTSHQYRNYPKQSQQAR